MGDMGGYPLHFPINPSMGSPPGDDINGEFGGCSVPLTAKTRKGNKVLT